MSKLETEDHIRHHVGGHHRHQIMPRVLDHAENVRKAAHAAATEGRRTRHVPRGPLVKRV